jgi:hypothetical protein
MPQGKGTYGSKVGRPPKKAKKGGKYALGGKIGDKTNMYDIYGEYIMPYNQEYMDKEEGGKIVNPPEPIEQMMPEFDARQRSTVSPVLDEGNQPMDKTGWSTGEKYGPDDIFPYGLWKKGGKVKKK